MPPFFLFLFFWTRRYGRTTSYLLLTPTNWAQGATLIDAPTIFSGLIQLIVVNSTSTPKATDPLTTSISTAHEIRSPLPEDYYYSGHSERLLHIWDPRRLATKPPRTRKSIYAGSGPFPNADLNSTHRAPRASPAVGSNSRWRPSAQIAATKTIPSAKPTIPTHALLNRNGNGMASHTRRSRGTCSTYEHCSRKSPRLASTSSQECWLDPKPSPSIHWHMCKHMSMGTTKGALSKLLSISRRSRTNARPFRHRSQQQNRPKTQTVPNRQHRRQQSSSQPRLRIWAWIPNDSWSPQR